jgi:hypothetical protein
VSPRAWELAEGLAEALLRRGGVHPGSSFIDVHALTTRLLGTRVYELGMPQAGRLVNDGNAWFVIVSADDPWVRRRFSVAHELAHWQLQHPGPDRALVGQALNTWRSEERLCETVAGALLLPRPAVCSHFGVCAAQHHQNLATLCRVARVSDVSLSSALVRLREVLRWRPSLLSWTRQAGDWLYDGEAGVRTGQLGAICPTEATDWALRQATARGAAIQSTVLPLVVHGREVLLDAELRVRDGSAVALVRLPAAEREPLYPV